ncbi:hypothetical protein SCHPADRAFT_816626 [Schizopora paradoxa]|uniref:CN hydrolase domain-containing protein n=1 Tax=Schizopora paradoxa TaxID=27342 RepID=A0A0H2S8Z4_9AGAM|nr:hypothetical protein SCHPADRAFT_816626 [Schizopora paradoxa]
MAFANIAPSFSALPAHITSALIFLLFLTTLTCITAVVTIYLDTRYRRGMRTPWTRLTLFPTLWSSALFIISSFSPIGRLAMWSPVTSLHAYTWLRPVGGPVAIDWVTAAWSVVLHELLGMWIMGPPKIVTAIEDEHLISVDESISEVQHQAQQPQRSKSLLYLSAMLCLLVLPSYSFDGLPLPIISSFTTPISMACALPLPSTVENENNKPSIDNYILETHRLTPLAKVVLWPEAAVRLQTPERRAYVIEQVQNNAQASVVAVSFEDLIPNKMQNGSGPWRHGMMIIDKDGLKAEYYKRVPVPFVEERSTSSKNKPLFFEYELVLRRNSRKVPIDWVDLPITAGFSLDFASNFPFSLSSRPALVLGAAHTWHPNVGIALWEQAKARSEELGSALLWCDGGEGGVSGVAAPGVDEILQVGSGSWVRTIGLKLPFEEGRTAYGFFGAWLAIPFIWGVFGVEWIVERTIVNLKGEYDYDISCFRRKRKSVEADEEASLLS